MRHLLYVVIFSIFAFTSSCDNPWLHKKKPIFFDAMMDLDDLYSLLLISKCVDVDLLGVSRSGTEIFHFNDAARNAASVLYLADETSVPLSGELSPAFCSGREPPHYFDEMVKLIRGFDLPKSPVPPLKETGNDLLHEIATTHSGKFTVLAVGPLTNVAHAITEHPLIKQKIERIVFLGGSLHTTESITVPLKKSWQFSSRYNLLIDPCAANIILTSGIPITIVPLDVTNLVPINRFILEKYAHPRRATRGSEFVMKVLEASLEPNTIIARTPFWNMIALMCLIDRKIIGTSKLPLKVITEPGKNYGELVTSEDGTITEVCTYVNADKFYKRLFGMVDEL